MGTREWIRWRASAWTRRGGCEASGGPGVRGERTLGADDVERAVGEMKARGGTPGPSWRAHRRTRPPSGSVQAIVGRVQPRREGERRALDGRFGRCGGSGEVHAFCGSCAAVGACCGNCSAERRRAQSRLRNQAWSKTVKGVASNQRRQARFRADRGRVTDATLPEGAGASRPHV